MPNTYVLYNKTHDSCCAAWIAKVSRGAGSQRFFTQVFNEENYASFQICEDDTIFFMDCLFNPDIMRPIYCKNAIALIGCNPALEEQAMELKRKKLAQVEWDSRSSTCIQAWKFFKGSGSEPLFFVKYIDELLRGVRSMPFIRDMKVVLQSYPPESKTYSTLFNMKLTDLLQEIVPLRRLLDNLAIEAASTCTFNYQNYPIIVCSSPFLLEEILETLIIQYPTAIGIQPRKNTAIVHIKSNKEIVDYKEYNPVGTKNYVRFSVDKEALEEITKP